GNDLGTIAQPGQTLLRAWLSPIADSNMLRGVALYRAPQETEGVAHLSILLFTVSPDADLPIAEIAKLACPPLPYSRDHHWWMSPSLEWVYVKEADQIRLAHFNFDEGSMTWAELAPFDGWADAAFTPDERWMVYRTGSGSMARCDLTSGSAEVAGSSSTILIDSDQGIFIFALSPDGTLFAYCDHPTNRLSIMNADDPSTAVTIRDAGETWAKLRFSDDGKWLAAGCVEATSFLWPLEKSTDKLNRMGTPQRFRGLSTPVLDIVFSPQVDSFVAYGTDAHFRHWSLDGTKDSALPEFSTAGGPSIYDLALSPDGRWCAAACSAENNGKSGLVKLINLGTREQHVIGRHLGTATGVAISPDGQWLASSGSDGMAFDWSYPAVIAAIENGESPPAPAYRLDMTDTRLDFERRLDFHPSGRLYVTSGDGILFEWNLHTSDPAASRIEHKIHTISYLLPDVCVSPDGNWLAVARHGWDNLEKGSVQGGNMVLLYDLSDPNEMRFHTALPANFLDTTNVVFSNDCRWLAAGAAGKSATVWDLAAPNIENSRRDSVVFDHELRGVAFSPDGRWLGLGASDSKLHLWNWQTGDTRTIATDKAIRAVEWCSPSQIVTGDTGGTVAIWETDIPKLTELARKTAGRELTTAERARYGL
ncbi:MAG: WD40 repeat protein, partial [Verrucomicrobiales bacterium]